MQEQTTAEEQASGAAAPAAAPGERGEGWRTRLAALSDRAGNLWTLGVLLIIVLVFAITTENFMSRPTWLATSIAAVPIMLLSLGQTFVIISRGIDLSVGAVLGLSGMIGAWVMSKLLEGGMSPTPIILIGLVTCCAVGLLAGAINGTVITRLKITPFVATLGMLGIASGITQLVNHGQQISNLPLEYGEFGNRVLFGDWVPVSVLIAAGIVLVAGLLLHKTRFGRRTFAIGSNTDAALRTGINVNWHLIRIYMLSGLFAGIAGFLVTAQLSLADVNAGKNLELSSIAAVVIGGASLFGGRGTVGGAVIGTFILTVLATGLVVAKVDAAWQVIVVGVILILAVWADQQRLRAARRA